MPAPLRHQRAPKDDAQADYDSLEQAARWYASLQVNQVSDEQKIAWQEWLAARPQNRRAWTHVEAVSHRFSPLRADGERQAAAVAISVSSTQSIQTRKRRTVLRGLAALGGAGLAAWGAWRFTPVADTVLAWSADHHTAVGEIKDFFLADGSHIWLNTFSALDVAFDDSRRLLRLRVGEVLVDTAKDGAGRPFFLTTDFGRMEALGTRFVVRQTRDHTQLTVFEGRVEIRNLAGQRAIVPAGQQRQFSADSITDAMPADAARQAWSRGVILAEDISLDELVIELARYQRAYVGVSPDIAGLRVSGRYPVANLPKVLGMLERDLPIQISRPLPWWFSIRKK